MNITAKVEDHTAFELKSNQFSITTIQLLSTNNKGFRKQLEASVIKFPRFFKRMPIIIDLIKLNGQNTNNSLDLMAIKALLIANEIIPVAIKNVPPELLVNAKDAQLSIMDNQPHSELKISVKKNPAQVIKTPVRSGQQIYAKNADLIIVGSVSSGAEVISDGHIHIYGTLRGKAFAGANGNQQAQIFCQHLQAELIAIAGHYRLKDDYQLTHNSNKPTFIELIDDSIAVKAID